MMIHRTHLLRNTLSLLLLIALGNHLAAQVIDQPIEQVGNKAVFMYNHVVLLPNELQQQVSSSKEALRLMKKARSNNALGNVLGAIGGGLIGWPLGRAIAGGDINWTVLGSGVVVAGTSIVFTSRYAVNAKEAVRVYNAGLDTGDRRGPMIQYGFLGNGLGFALILR